MRELVLAGNYEQFRNYCRLNSIDHAKFRYISSVQDIRGLSNTILRMVGTYWNHYDFAKYELSLYEYCHAHNIRINWDEAARKPFSPVINLKN